MASKYDSYWRERPEAVFGLFADARTSKQSEPLEVSELDTPSQRQNTRGTLEVVDRQPMRGSNSPV